MLPTGSARLRVDAKFYLLAMFFVLFDLKAMFIFAWAAAFRRLGWAAYLELTLFIAVLLGTLVYLWRQGALDWGPSNRERRGRIGGPP